MKFTHSHVLTNTRIRKRIRLKSTVLMVSLLLGFVAFQSCTETETENPTSRRSNQIKTTSSFNKADSIYSMLKLYAVVQTSSNVWYIKSNDLTIGIVDVNVIQDDANFADYVFTGSSLDSAYRVRVDRANQEVIWYSNISIVDIYDLSKSDSVLLTVSGNPIGYNSTGTTSKQGLFLQLIVSLGNFGNWTSPSSPMVPPAKVVTAFGWSRNYTLNYVIDEATLDCAPGTPVFNVISTDQCSGGEWSTVLDYDCI